jgi:flavin reductase (DIM6/NTAB) family NADH-FMN oxidoreductase RutF
MNASAATTLFAQTERELWLVTARAGARRGGLIATFVSQASIVPHLPRVVVGLAKQHYTRELVEASGAFALHLLGQDQAEWVWRFGLHSGRDVDKLKDEEMRDGVTGSPILAEPVGWLDCRVEAKLDTGDRTLYLAAVVEGGLGRQRWPLTFQHLVAVAPPDKLVELRKQLERDSAIDAAAILAWRQARETTR